MLSVERGQRLKLEGLAKVDWPLEVSLVVRGPATYDFSCFGVDRENKLSDDRYMVFYNQLRSPQGEISLQLGHNEAKFTVALSSLPPQIEKLVFTVNLDDQLAGHMQQISSQSVTLEQRGVKLAQLELRGSDFQSPVELHRVHRNYLSVETARQFQRQRAFPGGGGAHDCNNRRGGHRASTRKR